MKPNGLVLAGLIVTLVGFFIVIRHSLAIPSYWTPLLVGIGLLVAGVIWSAWQRKSKAS
jgi:predicted tellurium resistance membrane protein TerC